MSPAEPAGAPVRLMGVHWPVGPPHEDEPEPEPIEVPEPDVAFEPDVAPEVAPDVAPDADPEPLAAPEPAPLADPPPGTGLPPQAEIAARRIGAKRMRRTVGFPMGKTQAVVEARGNATNLGSDSLHGRPERRAPAHVGTSVRGGSARGTQADADLRRSPPNHHPSSFLRMRLISSFDANGF